MSIFAGVNGYLDDVPVEDVKRFETELLNDARARHADVLEGMRTGGALPEEQLHAAVKDFKDRFQASSAAATAASA